MDLLQECAKSFESLLPYQYHIVAGRKGKTLDFTISFDRADFHHLAGLHKLTDNVRFLTGKRAIIMQEILYGRLTIAQARQSAFFPKAEKDYAQEQPRYTLLKKEKINRNTGEITIQCDRLSPKEKS